MILKMFSMFFVLLLCHYAKGDGCAYSEGHCSEVCVEGFHSYTPGCEHVETQRTCDNPKATLEKGITCDLSRCDCDEPKVLDERTNTCVMLKDCSKPGDKVIRREPTYVEEEKPPTPPGYKPEHQN